MWTFFYEYDWLYIVSGQKTLRSESKIFCFVVALGEKWTDMERKKIPLPIYYYITSVIKLNLTR
jgi:hypothetical protein